MADDGEDFRAWRRNALAPSIRDDDDAAWSAFEHYLVSINRNIGRTARERKVPLDTIHRWSKQGVWAARAAAYDERLADARDEAAELAATDLARMVSALATLGAREVQLLAQAQASLDRPGIIRPNDALRMVDRGVTLLQLLGGKPTERVATEEPDLSRLTDEELEELARIRSKLSG